MYLLRLDDASDYMDSNKWNRMEQILDKYSIKPIVGIIPNNQDKDLINLYKRDCNFWTKVEIWRNKGWELAMHGYNHVCNLNNVGINPVNKKSEFAGLALKEQKIKMKKGFEIFVAHGIYPRIFFAPCHTYDYNTLRAIAEESQIRIISDTIANDVYKMNEFYFIPQQSGRVRKLNFAITTFCYHPNSMNEQLFNKLESFIKKNHDKFICFHEIEMKERKRNLFDKFLSFLYFKKKLLKC